MGHAQMGIAAMMNVAETAHHQGIDLYGEERDRINTGMEFQTALLLDKKASPPRPTPSWLCEGNVTSRSGNSRTWEIAYNHYHNRMNISLPHTAEFVAGNRPTWEALMMVWETLTHAEMG